MESSSVTEGAREMRCECEGEEGEGGEGGVEGGGRRWQLWRQRRMGSASEFELKHRGVGFILFAIHSLCITI